MFRLKYLIGRVYDKIKVHILPKLYQIRYGYRYVPWLLQVEPTHRCNAKCIFCPRDQITMVPDFDINFYKELVDNVPYVTQIHTQGFGDPLLYPHLVEMVEYASKRKKRVVFYTNASLLTEKLSKELLEAGLGQIRFSIDECDPEEYERLRPPLKWDVVFNNVLDFQKLRDNGGYRTTTVIRITDVKGRKTPINELVNFWKQYVDIVVVAPEIQVPTPKDYITKYYDGEPIDCPKIKNEMIVRYDGTMLICCQDGFRVFTQDNLNDYKPLTPKSILEAFNGPKFTATRKALEIGEGMPMRCKFCKC